MAFGGGFDGGALGEQEVAEKQVIVIIVLVNQATKLL